MPSKQNRYRVERMGFGLWRIDDRRSKTFGTFNASGYHLTGSIVLERPTAQALIAQKG